MRRIFAVTTVVAALVGATSATATPPNPVDQGQKLCARQGGEFFDFSPSYFCVLYPFTDRQVSQAQRLCERNGGVFNGFALPNRYDCNF